MALGFDSRTGRFYDSEVEAQLAANRRRIINQFVVDNAASQSSRQVILDSSPCSLDDEAYARYQQKLALSKLRGY